MHAVVVKVTIGDIEAAEPQLRERIVPAVKGAPGFVAGYWTRSDEGNNGLSMLVFESEEQARAAAEMISAAPMAETVTQVSIEVREVVANA